MSYTAKFGFVDYFWDNIVIAGSTESMIFSTSLKHSALTMVLVDLVQPPSKARH